MLKYLFLLILFSNGCLDVTVDVPKQPAPVIVIDDDGETDGGINDDDGGDQHKTDR